MNNHEIMKIRQSDHDTAQHAKMKASILSIVFGFAMGVLVEALIIASIIL